MQDLVRCPAGSLYDPKAHSECPCPQCWADRAFSRLDSGQKAVDQAGEIKETRPATQEVEASRGREAKPDAPSGPISPRAAPKSESASSLQFFGLRTRMLAAILAVLVVVAGVMISRIPRTSESLREENEFAAAHGDIAKLKHYVATCKTCESKSRALDEIAALENQQRAKTEEDQYQAARGTLENLRRYVGGCKVCAFTQQASEEISYLEARGNVDRLQNYLKKCRTCEFAAAAREEARGLEEAARVFTFEVCNKGSQPTAVAVSGRTNPDKMEYSVRGWGVVDAGACKPLGTFARGRFYAVAQVKGSRKGWYGDAVRHCVEIPGPFDRVASPNYTCPSGGRVVGFRAFDVAAEKQTWTLDGEPVFADDEYFALDVCNQYTEQASVAVAARREPNADWTVEGWWNTEPGKCARIGKFARGKIYFAAKLRTGSKGWYGTDTHQCVDAAEFTRNGSTKDACPSESRVIGLTLREVTTDSYRWSISGAPEFSPDEFFSFEVCNKSRMRASVGLMGRSDPASEFRVEGWHSVSPGSCEVIGRYARGNFYATASVWGNIKRGWWQKDFQLCVTEGTFNRTNPENYRCTRNESLMYFRKFSVTSPKLTWTLN